MTGFYRILIHAWLLVCLVNGLCHAEIYKWVDERGNTHYSQTPIGENAEKVIVKEQPELKQPAAGVSNKPQSSLEDQKKYSDYLEQERLERKEKREQKKQQQAEQRSKCLRVRADLDDMNQGGILYYELDENGERRLISDQRVEARKENMREYLRRNCGGV